jgi:hypothetical protein
VFDKCKKRELKKSHASVPLRFALFHHWTDHVPVTFSKSFFVLGFRADATATSILATHIARRGYGAGHNGVRLLLHKQRGLAAMYIPK